MFAATEYAAALDSLASGKPKVGTLMDRQSDLGVAFDQAWKSLIPAAIAATYSVMLARNADTQ